MTEPITQTILAASVLPRDTLFWLVIPPIVMAIAGLVHSLKNWNKPL